MNRRFTATEVLKGAGVKRTASGLALCQALVGNTNTPGAVDACAYAFAWLAASGRIPDCIPATAGECAKLIAKWTTQLGHAAVRSFEEKIREWNNHRRAIVEASVSRAGEEPAPRSE